MKEILFGNIFALELKLNVVLQIHYSNDLLRNQYINSERQNIYVKSLENHKNE